MRLRVRPWVPTRPAPRRPHRLTTEMMREAAAEHGGKLLSPHYQYGPTKLSWRCAAGHEFTMTGYEIRRGRWCPACGGQRRWTVEDMRRIAAERGGRCLSAEYVPKPARLLWRCARGHEWWKDGVSIAKGDWCLRCAGIARRLTIAELRRVAKERGGRVLSVRYLPHRKVRWRCGRGHEWLALGAAVKSGNWCPTCGGQTPLSIVDMRSLAHQRGGRCLSPRYGGLTSKLLWRCANGHEWRASPASVRNRGAWCPRCSGKARLTVEELDRLARSRGGRLVSKRYVNGYTPLVWRCKLGHVWRARAFGVKNSGTWCRRCALARRSL